MAHQFRFYRMGGLDQVALETGEDLAHLHELDQKLWVALSCPVKGLELEERTLELLDLDKDGRVRASEILAAIAWCGDRLKDVGSLIPSRDGLPLAAIDDSRPAGKALLGAVRHILVQRGKPEAQELTVADVADVTRVFEGTRFNGDGVIPPHAASDPALRASADPGLPATRDVIAAAMRGTWIDRAVMGFSVLGFSVPVFVIGYALIYLFAIELGWLPVQGYQRLAEGFWGFLERLILPSVTLAVIYVALIARITRTSVLEVLGADHVRTARAKGLGDGAVLLRHVLRNAAVPIVTVIGLGVALLIGGVVVTESVYGIPGLGRLTVDAVLARDYPTVQAVILLFSVAYVLINLLVDLTYTFLDPRIRY